jgi:TRAP-type C4-dicarboxylate transport system permease small subunit
MLGKVLERPRAVAGWLSDKAALLERFLCAVLISVFTLVLLANVISRYLFNSPLFFAEELALLLLVWMGYLAVSYSIYRSEQIGMGLVVDKLSEKNQRLVAIVVDLILVGISGILFWAALQWLGSSSVSFERAVTLNVPKWPFYLVIPLFWSLMLIHLIDHLLEKTIAAVAEET